MVTLQKQIIWASGFSGGTSLHCFSNGDYLTGYILLVTTIIVWIIGASE